jgi:SpoVK/Ycf46/Vps4 family AAA+-type ATPase
MTDESLLVAMERAVEQDPHSVALRLHLGRLLLEAGIPPRALEQAMFVLTTEPDHAEALGLAVKAAEATGDHDLAARYRRLLGVADGTDKEGERSSGDPETDVDPLELELQELLAADRIEVPGVTLADVGGLDRVKERLQTTFLEPLRHPELREAFGADVRGGLLLWGPPGCGKTFLAKAVAGELGARFSTLGLDQVLSRWMGEPERSLHAWFEAARRHTPFLMFIDEVDALGFRRSHLEHHPGFRNLVAQLLVELDGVQSNNEDVFLLAATNQPWSVDPALRRPGRFDRLLLVLPPDRPAREAILASHLHGRPVDDVNLSTLADRTELFSGADLAHVCQLAAQRALQESVAGGEIRPIDQAGLLWAVSEVSASCRPWFDEARNYALFANEGGAYDELLEHMRHHHLL